MFRLLSTRNLFNFVKAMPIDIPPCRYINFVILQCQLWKSFLLFYSFIYFYLYNKILKTQVSKWQFRNTLRNVCPTQCTETQAQNSHSARPLQRRHIHVCSLLRQCVRAFVNWIVCQVLSFWPSQAEKLNFPVNE